MPTNANHQVPMGLNHCSCAKHSTSDVCCCSSKLYSLCPCIHGRACAIPAFQPVVLPGVSHCCGSQPGCSTAIICRPQVKHFDEQQQQLARSTKNLHTAINRTATASAGNLAGTPQM